MFARTRVKSAPGNTCHRRGVTNVEVALTFPVLMLILTMSVEASRLNTLRNTLENATYEGARRGIVPGATNSDVVTATQSILRTINAKDAVITTTPTTITTSTTSLTVSVVVPLSSNSWIGRTSSRHMIRSCTLSRERSR